MPQTHSEYLNSLYEIRDQITTQLATVTTDTQLYSVDGQSVHPKRHMLLEQLRMINEQISETEGGAMLFSVADTH